MGVMDVNLVLHTMDVISRCHIVMIKARRQLGRCHGRHGCHECQEGLMSGIIQMEKEDEMFNLSSEAKLMMIDDDDDNYEDADNDDDDDDDIDGI